MADPHYFAPRPGALDVRREIKVTLRGRPLTAITSGSVFSGSRLDPGTAVLLGEAPDPAPAGTLVDLGSGWGPLTLALALAAPAARVIAVDVNDRALELTRANAARHAPGRVLALRPEEAGALLDSEGTSLAGLWSNPPIRVGKAALHALLREWLPRLAPGATAELVVAKNLGADSLLTWMTEQGWAAHRRSTAKGYRVLTVEG